MANNVWIIYDLTLTILKNVFFKEVVMKELPRWLIELENEDLNFIKQFIMASGSLKDIARYYEVTYPTIRLRLDKLIQKIEINDNEEEKPFITLVKQLAIEDKMDIETAKLLIESYKNEVK